MVSWGQLIWIFFPIPVFSLLLLSIPGPRGIEKFGAFIVEKIFFTKIRAGPIRLRLLWLFFVASIIIFAGSVQRLNENGVCTHCKFHAETIWYTKALKFRAERNFWLSLFNSFLWILVWKVYTLKKRILSLKDQVKVMEARVSAIVSERSKEVSQKNDKSPSEVEPEPKEKQAKKKD